MLKSFFKFTFGFLTIIIVSFLVLSSLNYWEKNKQESESSEQQEIIANLYQN